MKIFKSILFLFITLNAIQGFAQEIPTLKLEAYKRIDEPARNEVSGIVKSKVYDDTFWVHGDSGTPDRIYAINEEGEIKSEDKDYRGAKVKGAKNVDWEDIAIGEHGTLILADFGNNCECRDDLKIFILEEPNPKADEVEVLLEYKIIYPERTDWFGRLLRSNYNAEAVFQLEGVIYILTKQRNKTSLFQLVNPQEDDVNELELLEVIETEHYVTAADISEDGREVAVLTYDQVMIYEFNEGSFSTSTYRTAFLEGVEQIESIAFLNEYLIIAEENGGLYRVEISDLVEVVAD